MNTEQLKLKQELDRRNTTTRNAIKYKNRGFTTGEESILEQASIILFKRSRPYYSIEHMNKRLILIHCRGHK